MQLYGRELRLRSCDPQTRAWYESEEARVEYGATPQPANAHEAEQKPAPRVFAIPPHTGIGSEEDSLQSVFTIKVRPLKKDYAKWALNDGVVYRFHARLDVPGGAATGSASLHQQRRFTISVYPADDSLAIYEVAVKNTGFGGGKFLARNRHRKSDGSFYAAADFKPGAVVSVYGHRFVVLDADKFTREVYVVAL